jgi:hypothetical protein
MITSATRNMNVNNKEIILSSTRNGYSPKNVSSNVSSSQGDIKLDIPMSFR